MATMLDDPSTAAVNEAMEANLTEFLDTLRAWPRAETHFEADLHWSITDQPFFLYNSQWNPRLTSETVDSAIAASIARGRAKNVSLAWWVSPFSTPSSLGTRLVQHGFHEEMVPGMAADLSRLNENLPRPAGLRVEQVLDLDDLRTWCRTFLVGYGLPESETETLYDWFSCVGLGPNLSARHYLARLDGEPVGTASVCLAAGVAGIYDVATLPVARRKGVGAAVTLAPLLQARAEGYRFGVLQSSEMGHAVYQRIGFEETCKFDLYVWEG